MLEKPFGKANKKFAKELDTTRKKQNKEVLSVIKTQCTAFEKAAKGKNFQTTQEVSAFCPHLHSFVFRLNLKQSC